MSGPPLPERAAQVELATSLMRCHLPEYLCNCLLACGFDTLKAIAEMKVNSSSECSDDSVQEIETYINENHSGNIKYLYMEAATCKIPPGHRLALQQFIALVKVKIGIRMDECQCGRKRKMSAASACEKPEKAVKREASTSKNLKGVTSNANAELKSIYQQVRVSISKWQKKQEKKYQELREFEDFEVIVEVKEGDVSCQIKCKCNEFIKLQNNSHIFMLSNWTRHILKYCPVLKIGGNKGKSKQLSLVQCVYSCKQVAAGIDHSDSTSDNSFPTATSTPTSTPPITPLTPDGDSISLPSEADLVSSPQLNKSIEDTSSSVQLQGSQFSDFSQTAVSFVTTRPSCTYQSANTFSHDMSTVTSSSVFRIVPPITLPVKLEELQKQTGQDALEQN